MTAEERKQVVELLRCAADADTQSGNAMRVLGPVLASWHLGYRDQETFHPVDGTVALANAAWMAACADLDIRWPYREPWDAYRGELLEAAQRVEEGSWP